MEPDPIDNSPRTVVEAVGVEEWRELQTRFLDFSYRQLVDYEQCLADRQSARLERVKVVRGGEVLGLASVRIKALPALRAGLAYVGGAPLTRQRSDSEPDRLSEVLRALHRTYVVERGLQLRVSLPVVFPEQHEDYRRTFVAQGFHERPGDRIYRTFVLDLSTPLDQLHAALSRRWRRQLRKAEKAEIEVETGTDDALFREFCDLYARFREWKGFGVNLDARFHFEVHQRLPVPEKYIVALARHDNQVIGGHVSSIQGDTAVYLLGATELEARDLRPGHRLHWHMVDYYRRRGVRWYDLGGSDPVENPGVHEFKAGMGGTELVVPGPFRCDGSMLSSILIAAGEKVRAAVRRR